MRVFAAKPSTYFAVLALLLTAWPALAHAMENRLYGGFAYTRSNRTDSHDMGGFVLGFSLVQNSHLGWTAEGGMQFGGTQYQEVSPLGYRSSLMQALAQIHVGPEVTGHRGRTTLYLHGLAGYGGWILNTYQRGDEGGFSLAVGGGVDVRVSPGLALRIIQIDYIPIWLHAAQESLSIEPSLPQPTSPTHNLRIGFSLVF